jgi:hypothetical protein
VGPTPTTALSALIARRPRAALEEKKTVEVALNAAQARSDPFNQLEVDVLFTDPAGTERRVPAFWAGGNAWKARYSSSLAGTHSYRSVCSDASDADLHGVSGAVENSTEEADRNLHRGAPRVSCDRRYLERPDGEPFFWLGDTWWMGLSHRLHWPDEFKALAADRKGKGFSVIQIVAGLFPDMHPFDARGANEAGFPWEAEYARIRPEYFDAADQRLRYLIDEDLTPCIVGAWGYFMLWMGVEKLKQHWRYLIARYGSWPVVWCVAGEANLPWYLAENFPCDDREQVHGWTEVMRYVRVTDPFHRLVTIHPTAINRYTSRNATDDENLLDIDMLQTPHGQQGAVVPTVKAVRESYAAVPRMPVIDGEATYERLLDRFGTTWTRRMFWLCMMNGAAGHTYGANGIWQCNRKGDPHGPSPHGGSWGDLPWEQAMRLPGSSHVSVGTRLLARYPWRRMEPHPEWAAFAAGGVTDLDGPQAAGIPDVARFVYVPRPEPVVVSELVANAAYRVTLFDPLSGATTSLSTALANAEGRWTWPAEDVEDHDWLLIIEGPNR